MNEISIGAVGAALITGAVSLVGLVLGKEAKVSEFRQAWIDELRKCLVLYLVSINSISDILRSGRKGDYADQSLLENYRNLNSANHGIKLRVNDSEEPSKKLLAAMEEFEEIALSNSGLTPEKIKKIEADFNEAAKELLRFEWKRVKKGEPAYIWARRGAAFIVVAILAALALSWVFGEAENVEEITHKLFLL